MDKVTPIKVLKTFLSLEGVKSKLKYIARVLYKIVMRRSCALPQFSIPAPAFISTSYEPLFQQWVKKMDKAKNFVDIGANIGFYSEMASKRANIVFAFEPNPKVFTILVNRTIKNGNIICYNCALGNFIGIANLHIGSQENSLIHPYGNSSLVINHGRGDFKVAVKRMDDFNLGKIGMIKIDVEGYEIEVLKGGFGTIQKNKPILLIEIHSFKNFKEVYRFLLGLDYRLEESTIQQKCTVWIAKT